MEKELDAFHKKLKELNLSLQQSLELENNKKKELEEKKNILKNCNN
jgi:hypothetical protein